jgi:integrase
MASARKRGTRWTGLYRDQDGAQKSAGTFDSEAEALKAATAHEAVEATGIDAKVALSKPVDVYADRKRGKLTVAGYAPVFLAGHRLEATSRESYAAMIKHVVKGLGAVTLAELDPPKVRTFIRGLEGTMSNATVGHVMTVLRAMCQTAVVDKLMEADPTAGIKIAGRRAREMRILTKDESVRLLASVPEHYRLLVRTLLSTGLRWGEAMGLKASDITPLGKGYVIRVRRVLIQPDGKPVIRDYGKTSRAMRNVTIDGDLGAALISAATADGFVFRAPRGGWITRANFRHVWIKVLESAGITGFRVHDCRHTHASWMANTPGITLVAVRDRLGHSDIRITSRYLHTVETEDDPFIAALSAA